ncbi:MULTISPECIES: peptidylprolyl isomerase [unclassified Burkholderia]|uniref:peptidylprolyl isomerase n=1 Tax=unclassified Burkholderia TaxID=2613784 RepID=UPI00075298AE|nr:MULTISPECIES: peptidylprolyl isomerase [unclassified Burkholderia]KVN17101.1 peptidylprolyl isomerase [Burkholderia sp. MSMB1552]KWZ50882.1 peptidylprolyl isomerase [Burkholderia sp. MSMB1588]
MNTIDETLDTRPHARVSVNGVEIGAADIAAERAHHPDADDPLDAARRALVVHELLRQRAVALGLAADGAPLGDDALDALLARELTHLPEPARDDCERYYRNHAARFRRRDIVHASHILFAVTDATPLAPLRREAEAALARALAAPQTFETLARELSNCPSAAVGGNLGQLLRGDSVPEFDAAVFDTPELGVLPRLVNTRFGFHIVRIERREPGDPVPFDAVAADIAAFLAERVRHKAIQQYVTILASRARIEGVAFGDANGPLVQ